MPGAAEGRAGAPVPAQPWRAGNAGSSLAACRPCRQQQCEACCHAAAGCQNRYCNALRFDWHAQRTQGRRGTPLGTTPCIGTPPPTTPCPTPQRTPPPAHTPWAACFRSTAQTGRAGSSSWQGPPRPPPRRWTARTGSSSPPAAHTPAGSRRGAICLLSAQKLGCARRWAEAGSASHSRVRTAAPCSFPTTSAPACFETMASTGRAVARPLPLAAHLLLLLPQLLLPPCRCLQGGSINLLFRAMQK